MAFDTSLVAFAIYTFIYGFELTRQLIGDHKTLIPSAYCWSCDHGHALPNGTEVVVPISFT
jgi:hypothetical protein